VASIPAPPVPLSQVGCAAHDVGLAGLLGGNVFGRLALHPSVTEISDKTERGKLVNAAMASIRIINSLSLGAVVAGWLGARGKEAAPNQLSEAERRLAVAKDVLVGVVAVTGAVTAAEGVRFSRQAPGGAVRSTTATTRRPKRPRRSTVRKHASTHSASPHLQSTSRSSEPTPRSPSRASAALLDAESVPGATDQKKPAHIGPLNRVDRRLRGADASPDL
jgi:hypothetical protein